jgi:hypothetical protein
MPVPTISLELAQLWREIKEAEAATRCEVCGGYGRHLVPDFGNYCDVHFRELRDREGRDFGYRVRRGRLHRVIEVDMWTDGDIEYGAAE